MHRTTTTTARAVLGMAVWAASGLAVSGCVTVAPHPDPVPPGGRPAPAAGPRIVQGPAREALRAPPSEPAETAATAEPTRPPTAARAAPDRPGRPEPQRSAPPVRRPGAPSPAPRAQPRPRSSAHADVCALSEAYGGWRPDSPEARLCRSVYGKANGAGGG